MNKSQINRSIKLLLVEDNPGDAYIIKNYLQTSKIPYNFDHLVDGEQLMSYLYREGDYAKVSLPELVLLDLNLPKKNGFEVLKEIKSHPQLKSIPVIILTSSRAEKDILESYRLYANCYITKPFEYSEFIDTIRKIEIFWLKLVHLPSLKSI
ncbi:MAG: response regulator [Prochloraceae cyanobacterium]|nr:response regulator [Prochloraceae cyanobacterium]